MSKAIKRSDIFEQISKSERKEMFKTAEERIKSKAQINWAELSNEMKKSLRKFIIWLLVFFVVGDFAIFCSYSFCAGGNADLIASGEGLSEKGCLFLLLIIILFAIWLIIGLALIFMWSDVKEYKKECKESCLEFINNRMEESRRCGEIFFINMIELGKIVNVKAVRENSKTCSLSYSYKDKNDDIYITTLKEPFCDGAEEFAIAYRDDIDGPKIEYSARKIVLPFSDDPEETDKYLKQLNS